ncbi:MAG: LacI family DNA-binding transcriptional regulator [Anaerolineae bacterium]
MAERAGVSRQTVSRVINNKGGVADETRARIQGVIESMGYRPNLAARGLTQNRTHVIGMVVPYSPQYLFRDPHLLKQMSAVDQVLGLRGYSLLLTTAISGQKDADPCAQELTAFERLVETGYADGVILCETAFATEGIALLEQHDYSWVILGYYRGEESEAYAVHADDRGGARQAIMHLLSLGHQRIGIISGPKQSIRAVDERLTGCHIALEEHHLALDPALVAYGDFTMESGTRAAVQLMQQNPPPTAIFALNDRMAVGAMQYLQREGWRVPEDISIVGFDDVPVSTMCTPRLTTIHQPAQEMGEQATRLLFDLIEGQTVLPQPVVLPTELIVRESTGLVKGGR